MQSSAPGFPASSRGLLVAMTLFGSVWAPALLSADLKLSPDHNETVQENPATQEKATTSPSASPAATSSDDAKTASEPENTKPKSPQNGRGLPPQEIPGPPKTERQLAEERKARDAAKKRGEITFDDLKFDIEKDGEYKPEMITPAIKDLEKKTLKIRGFILPNSVFQTNGIKQFVLVRDNRECCFGPGAAIYDCVWVEMAAGKTATFSTQVVTVKGKFAIDEETFKNTDGYAIFKMTAEEVK
ncbi:MAG: DUF3299 domain-containing protein [Pirellula sp.]